MIAVRVCPSAVPVHGPGVRLWQRLQEAVAGEAHVQVHDRSPLCTLALARHLGHPVPPLLEREVTRVIRERVYAQPVFLLCPLGFITPTAVRRISYAESVEFGALHEQVYQEHGFDIAHVGAGTATSRAAAIVDVIALNNWTCSTSTTDHLERALLCRE